MSENAREIAGSYPWAEAAFEGMPASFPVETPIAVQLGDLTFACHLHKHTGSTGLLVMLFGTVGDDGLRPILGKRQFGDRANLDTLVISDPSLLLDLDLRTGIFLGPRDQNPLDGVAEITRAAAISLGWAPEDSIFLGISSGGFAALMAATRMGARSVSVNPQLDLPTLRSAVNTPIVLERFEPGMTPERLTIDYPVRTNCAAAVIEARSQGRAPRSAIIQNRLDKHHYTRHLTPFCEAVGAAVDGGVSEDGSILTVILDYPEGHNTTPEVLDLIFTTGIPFVAETADLPIGEAPSA